MVLPFRRADPTGPSLSSYLDRCLFVVLISAENVKHYTQTGAF
jgi:hypothetical protein